MGKRTIFWIVSGLLICIMSALAVLTGGSNGNPDDFDDFASMLSSPDNSDDVWAQSLSDQPPVRESITPDGEPAQIMPSPDSESTDPSEIAISGTVTVQDETGKTHPSEDGSFRIMMWTDNTGSPHSAKVVKGKWTTRVPPDVELSFSDFLIGGRLAKSEEVSNRMPIPEDGKIDFTVRWFPESRLHVKDQDSGIELYDVDVAIGDSFNFSISDYPIDCHPIYSNVQSPLILGNKWVEGYFSNNGENKYHARSPGYAWGSTKVDLHKGGDFFIHLERGGELVVKIHNLDLSVDVFLRLRDTKESYYAKHIERIPDKLSNPEINTYLDKVKKRTQEDSFDGRGGTIILERELYNYNPVHISSLKAGQYIVSAEIGDWLDKPIVLGCKKVEVRVGERTSVDLHLDASPVRTTAPFKGSLILPSEWELETFRLVLSLEDVSLGHVKDYKAFEANEMDRSEKAMDTYFWDAGFVQPGLYKARVHPLDYVTTINVGPEGNVNAVVDVPPPAQVSMQIVEASTGAIADIDQIYWHIGKPHQVGSYRSETVKINPDTNCFDFKAPSCDILVQVRGSEYRFPKPFGYPLTIVPGSNTLTVEIEKSCGFILVFKDGDKILPHDEDWEIKPYPEKGMLSYGRSPHPDGRRFTVKPGTYMFKIPNIPGYKPVEDQTVHVRANEFLRHEIQLERL